MSLFAKSVNLVYSALSRLVGMLWPSHNGTDSAGRGASVRRAKSVQSNASGTSPARRTGSISPTTTTSHQGTAPPLVPPSSSEGRKGGAPKPRRRSLGMQQAAIAGALPGFLANPICVNHTGKRMDLEERRVKALVNSIPEVLKGIKRMCLGLGFIARSNTTSGGLAAPSPTGDKEAASSSRSPSATVPVPAASSGAVIATKRTGGAGGVPSPSTTTTAATPLNEVSEVDKVVKSVRLLEALLFPLSALQTPRPFALPVTSKATLAKRTDKRTERRRRRDSRSTAAEKVDNSALSYYPVTLRNVSPKNRRRAWQAFLQKSTNAFALLIGSLRCEAVHEAPSVCVELVTLLYHIVRNIPSSKAETSLEKEKRAVKYCEKLGIVKVLSSVMRRYHAELQKVERKWCSVEEDTDSSPAALRARNEVLVERFQCLRVIEAAALLYTEVARVNVKVNSVLRLSKDLRRILDTAQYVSVACVLRTLQNHTKLSDFGCQPVQQVMKGVSLGGSGGKVGRQAAAVKEALSANRRYALTSLEAVSRETSFHLGVLAHLLMTMFMSCRTALAAQEVGLKGVSLGARTVVVLSEFVYVTLPKVRRVLAASLPKGSGLEDSGADAAAGVVFREPAWVQLYKRRVEMALFWATALVQRICENDKKTNFTEELHDRNHVMASLFLVLKSTGKEVHQGDSGSAAAGDAAGHDVAGEPDGAAVGIKARRRSSSTRSLRNTSFSGGAYDFDACRGSFASSSSPTGAVGGDGEMDQEDVMNENEEMTLAVMATMSVVLRLNHSRAVAELAPVCGGLAGVVKEVLKFRSESVEQWHRYLMHMSSMYGVRLLPARAGESAYGLDCRLPTFMLDDFDAPAAHDAGSRASEVRPNNDNADGSNGDPLPATGEADCTHSPQSSRRSGDDVSGQQEDGHAALVSPTIAAGTGMATAANTTAKSSAQSLFPAIPSRLATPESASVALPQAAADTAAQDAPTLPSVSSHAERRGTDEGCSAACSSQRSANVSFTECAAAERSASQGPARGTSPSHHTVATTDLNRYQLLLVDRRPAAFSPELSLGETAPGEDYCCPVLDPESTLELHRPGEDYELPWHFTEPGPPETNLITPHQNENGSPLPLQAPPREQRIAVLKHHISRLRALSDAASDYSKDPSEHHHYTVVYERDDAVSRLTVHNAGEGEERKAPYDAVPNGPDTPGPTTLTFSSDFESGNLRRAVRVSAREYDLVLNWDTSSNGFTQWFCFAVSNYEPGATYRFNIINMEKKDSCFNAGQRPLMLWVPPASDPDEGAASSDSVSRSRSRSDGSKSSTPRHQPSREGQDWQRVGQDIYYFMNSYGRPDRVALEGRPFPLPSRAALLSQQERAARQSGSTTTTTAAATAAAERRCSSSTSTPAPAAVSATAQGRPSRGARPCGRPRAQQQPRPRPSLSPAARSSRDHSTPSKGRATSTTAGVGSSPQSTAARSSYNGSRGVSPQRAAISRHATTTTRTASVSAPPATGKGKGTSPTPTATATTTTVADPADFSTDFFTLTFSVTMPAKPGRVYLTNCFPYTYTELRQHLKDLAETRSSQPGAPPAPSDRYVAMQSLCRTMGGLPVPLLTVTARTRAGGGAPYTAAEIRARPVCVITARIHPGESNSSWMMHGMLEALLRSDIPGTAGGIAKDHQDAANDAVQHLLRTFVFKLVPMLNADGVVMGNHRCSIAGVDLNRDYLRPDAEVNPTVYAVHRYLQHVIDHEGRTVALFADFHGHSVAKNFLLYGCTQALADGLARRLAKDKQAPEEAEEEGELPGGGTSRSPPTAVPGVEPEDGPAPSEREAAIAFEKLFPILLAHATPSFGLSQCSFSMQKFMRKTGRVLQYRKYGIRMSYTIEGTMAGGSGASFVCPWTVPMPSSTGTGGGLTEDDTNKETHYTQDSYSALGHSFLSTLHTLVAIDEVTRRIVDGELRVDTADCHSLPASLLHLAWAQLSLSGTGKAAPLAACEVAATTAAASSAFDEASLVGRVAVRGEAAGAYVLATRAARRTGATPASSQHTSPPTDSPLQPSYTMVPEPEPEEEEEGTTVTTATVTTGQTTTYSPALVDIADKYQAAMRFLFTTSASRVANDGDNEEDSDGGDNDSDDGGARTTSLGKRRATPTGAGGKKTKKKAGGPAKRGTPKRASVAAPKPSAAAAEAAPVAASPGTTDDGREATQLPLPDAQQQLLAVGVAGAEDAGPASPVGDDTEQVLFGNTANGEDESSTRAVDAPTEAVGSPREDDDGDEDGASDDGGDDGFVILLSDNDDAEDSDSDDEDDEEEIENGNKKEEAAPYETAAADGCENDEEVGDDEDTFVDNGSDFDDDSGDDDSDYDDYDDADYGELQPMPSNVFS